MPFVTQVDISNNRQAKERPRTISTLSGATVFGIPFSAMTSGPDYQNEVITSSLSGLTSTFTGTSATTVYTWAQPDMVLGESVLSAITISNSGVTQNTDSVFSAATTMIIDGNSVVLTYTGVSFDVRVNEMVELAPNLYSGNSNTVVLNYLSAGTLDFTGRTIWADNPEITRTDRLIVSRNPTIGYVLTCVDNEGMVGWFPSSGGTTGGTSTDVFVNSGVYTGSTIEFTNTTGGTFSVTGITGGGGSGGTLNTYVSGGTYNGADIEFTNTTGGTFNVTGITDNDTHIFVTGGTCSGLEMTFTNNTGGTFTVTGCTSSGGTTLWSAGTGNGTVVLNDSGTFESTGLLSVIGGAGNTNNGNFNLVVGGANILRGSGGIVGGSNNTINSDFSFITGANNVLTSGATASAIIGGAAITGTSAFTAYVPNLNIDTPPSTGLASDLALVRALDGTIKTVAQGGTDVFVSGGTATTGGTIEFTNTTGGTFDVTGVTTSQPFTNGSTGIIYNTTNWTDNGDGTITLPTQNVVIASDSNWVGDIGEYTVASGTSGTDFTALSDGDTNWIYIDYNGGSPIYVITNVEPTLTLIGDKTRYLVVYRAGIYLHVLDYDHAGTALPNKTLNRLDSVFGLQREDGLVLSLSGGTNVGVISAGNVWSGVNRIAKGTVNTNDDLFFNNYHSGGAWTYDVTGNTINNTHYDNGTNLVTLTSNRYVVNWIYDGIESANHVYQVVGSAQYTTVASAQLEAIPAVPELISSHAILVGRVIIQEGDTGGVVESAFDVAFHPSQVTYHNDLANIQGGTANEYYHLTAAEYAALGSGDFVEVSGDTMTGDLTVQADLAVSGSSNTFKMVGDGSLASPEFEITSTNQTIFNMGFGRIYTDSIFLIQAPSAAKTSAYFDPDGKVEFKHNNSDRFETTATGIDLTGEVDVDGNLTATSASATTITGGTLHLTNTPTLLSGGTDFLVRNPSTGEVDYRTIGGITGATVDVITTATTSAYTITNNVNTIFMDCTDNDVTATLPSALANPGFVVTVLRQDNTGNIGTVDTGVSDLVQMTTSVIVGGYTSLTFISNGINRWWIK